MTEVIQTLEEIEVDADDPRSLIEATSRSAAPVVLPPRPAPPSEEPELHHRAQVLDHLLGMARQYARNGSIRQAIELFFEVVADHAGTSQAVDAEEHLLAIAQHYEDQGELRQARGLYERLLKVS
ncbi:tetratricopeptide repeat protein [Aquisphaera insulae]|uniref:tetratricopeptide repeat protein n=1 Tax=Aquisphaera insulae TaxID=2712864 RepID=UPI0013EE3067|nr:hypothetical protein [Aquisphaera insulae]